MRVSPAVVTMAWTDITTGLLVCRALPGRLRDDEEAAVAR
jgi:hypothetical protein